MTENQTDSKDLIEAAGVLSRFCNLYYNCDGCILSGECHYYLQGDDTLSGMMDDIINAIIEEQNISAEGESA